MKIINLSTGDVVGLRYRLHAVSVSVSRIAVSVRFMPFVDSSSSSSAFSATSNVQITVKLLLTRSV